MNIRKLLLAAGALVAFAAAPAVAQDVEAQKGYKCQVKALAADWMIIIYNGRESSYCEASIDNKGRIGTSACYENKTDKLVGDISGSISIAKHCAMTGTVTYKPSGGKAEKAAAELYMDAAETSFAGVLDVGGGQFNVVQAIRMK